MGTGVKRRVGSASKLLILAVGLTVAGALSPVGTQVTTPGDGGTDPLMGMTMGPGKDGHAWLRAAPVCLSGLVGITWPATITGAELYGVSGDIRLDEVAVTTRTNGVGSGSGTLRAAGFDPTRKTVSSRCDGTVADELSLQYSLTGPVTGRAAGVRLTYGLGRTVDLGIAVTLCGAKDPDPPQGEGTACSASGTG